MTTKEGLEAARARISDPNDWCKYVSRCGGSVCALGALREVLGTDYVNWEGCKEVQALTAVLPSPPESEMILTDRTLLARTVSYFNDTQPHACVIAAFDAAIEAATD